MFKPLSRRGFLKSTSATLSLLSTRQSPLRGQAGTGVILTKDHLAAVTRPRRIVVQDDPSNFDPDPRLSGIPFSSWLDYRFSYIDEPGCQIDSVFWDVGSGQWAVYPSKLLPASENLTLVQWRNQNIDFVKALVDECHKRKLEAFWNERVSEVDSGPAGNDLEMKLMNPVKAAHPAWTIRSWWWQGLWNLSNPGTRQYRLEILKEIATTYDFDGIQLDFARHMPCLPPQRQWELREGATEYVRQVRLMLLEQERRRGRPYLLAARVPESLRGCHIDGLDVEVWAHENLVDIFSLGERSSDVDLAAFRRVVSGKMIKLQPCLDDHHATDGYRYPPVEFFRGVFGKWWQQGADSVMTFNWSCASPEAGRTIGAKPGPRSHQQAYHCIGSPVTLRSKDKLFTVQRRGGYPWSEGFFCRNDYAPLPIELENNGTASHLPVEICGLEEEGLKEVRLSIIFYGAAQGDSFEVKLNGIVIGQPQQDFQWKDPQLFCPRPQPDSGGSGHYKVDPNQKLMRLTFSPPPSQFATGRNNVEISIANRVPYPPCFNIRVEKIEILAKYA